MIGKNEKSARRRVDVSARMAARVSRNAIRQLALEEIVLMLNGDGNKEHPLHAATQANLIQLIQAWNKAKEKGWNRFEREHDAPLPTLLKTSFPPGCPTWQEIEKRCQAFLFPSGTGAYPHVEYVGEKGRPWTSWDTAAHLFINLITNPAHIKLAGPCERCRKYYIKKRTSQKVYCSRTCGNAATAIIRNREKWQQQRDEKLERASKTAQKWARSKTAEPWKEYVCEKHRDITPKFLTRAVNNRELSEPTKE